MTLLSELNESIVEIVARNRYSSRDRDTGRQHDIKYNLLIKEIERNLAKCSNVESDEADAGKPIRVGIRDEFKQKCISDMFKNFITPAMVNKIAKHTNPMLEQTGKYARMLNDIEMYGIIGLRLLVASNEDKINCIWKSEHMNKMYNGAISRKRYTEVNRQMRFNSEQARQRALTPPLEVKTLCEMFADQCTKVFTPSEQMAVCNLLFDFEGCVNFQANTNELPTLNQSFLWILSDLNHRYISDFRICYGKKIGICKDDRSNKRIVKSMVKKFVHPNRQFLYHTKSASFWTHFTSDNTCAFDRSQWAHSMFYSLVNFATINTYTCCEQEDLIPGTIKTWRQFVKLLACELIYPLLIQRFSYDLNYEKRYPLVVTGAKEILDHLNQFRPKNKKLKLQMSSSNKDWTSDSFDSDDTDDAGPCVPKERPKKYSTKYESDSTYVPKYKVSRDLDDSSESTESSASFELNTTRFNKNINKKWQSTPFDGPFTHVRNRSQSPNQSHKHSQSHSSFSSRITRSSKSPSFTFMSLKDSDRDLIDTKGPRENKRKQTICLKNDLQPIIVISSDSDSEHNSLPNLSSIINPVSSPLVNGDFGAKSTFQSSQTSVPCLTYDMTKFNSTPDDSYSISARSKDSGGLKACFYCSQNDLTPSYKRVKYNTCCISCYKYVCSSHAQVVFKCLECCDK